MPSPSPRPSHTLAPLVPDLGWSEALLLLAALASLVALAAAESAGPGAEIHFLTVLSLPVLVTLAAWSPARDSIHVAGFTLAVVASIWILPSGEARLATVGSLLVLGLVVSFVETSRAARPPAFFSLVIPFVALRYLWRPRLLAPLPSLWEPSTLGDGSNLVWLSVGPALLLAAALWLLAASRGFRAAFLGCALPLVLAGGPTFTTALVLVLLAAGETLRCAWNRTWPRWIALAALVALAAPLGWQTRLALVGIVAAAAGLLPRQWSWIPPGLGILATGILVPQVDGLLPLAILWLIPILLPGVIVRRWWGSREMAAELAAGVALAALGLLLFPGIAGFALGCGWLALRCDSSSSSFSLQAAWSGSLMALATLLATLPWAHPQPILGALELFGLRPGAAGAVVVVLAWLLIEGAPRLVRRMHAPGPELAVGLITILLLIGWSTQVERPGGRAIDGPFLLDTQHRSITRDWGDHPIEWLEVDSTSSHTAEFPRGFVLATLDLLDAHGRTVQRLRLRQGSGSGDWTGTGSRPRAHRVGIASDGRFHHRYRRRWPTDPQAPLDTRARSIRITRSSTLPENVSVAVHRLVVSP